MTEFLQKLLNGQKVEWKKLGEVTQYEQPTKYLVKTQDYNDSFATPVLTAGKTFILGYTDEVDGIYEGSHNPVIIFDDFTTANKWVDFDFKAKSSAMKMITSSDDGQCILKYVYYWLNTLPNELMDGDHKRQWISNFCNKSIPLPTLPVQKEIVRILDTLTTHTAELKAELKAELTARKKQYAYYRDKLLTFGDGVEWKKLGEVCEVQRGRRLTKKELSDEYQFPVFHGGLEPLGRYLKSNRKSDTIMIINVGASAGTIGYSAVDFWSSDGCYCLEHSSIINNKFLYYLLIGKQNFLMSKVRKAGIPTLDAFIIEKLQIPIPTLPVQKEIVAILDKFDTLTNSITKGLPKEIELRTKQYEYYRNELLNFKK
ncbi:MAG: type I restriction enzyme S subunit [Candidatus Deianiraeaceae bacterium]|jgi:type I restriction enzyme S subunit